MLRCMAAAWVTGVALYAPEVVSLHLACAVEVRQEAGDLASLDRLCSRVQC